MTEYSVKPLVPAATEGNLTELIAHRAWFEPERIIMSRPLGDGWQPVTAREVEAEVRATAKGLVAAGINIDMSGQFWILRSGSPVAVLFQSSKHLRQNKLIGF